MAKFEFRTGIYEGEAIDNIPNGKGKVTFKAGGYYEGDFVNGQFHGNGKCYLTWFGFYDGSWSDNHFVEGKAIAGSNILPSYTAGTVFVWCRRLCRNDLWRSIRCRLRRR